MSVESISTLIGLAHKPNAKNDGRVLHSVRAVRIAELERLMPAAPPVSVGLVTGHFRTLAPKFGIHGIQIGAKKTT